MQDSEKRIAEKPSVTSKFKGVEYIGLVGSDVALDSYDNHKWLSTFMRGIKISKEYEKHTLGGIMAIPVESFIIGARANNSISILNSMLGTRTIINTIKTDYLYLSSTKVREAIKNQSSIIDMVNPKVKDIIYKYKLYY